MGDQHLSEEELLSNAHLRDRFITTLIQQRNEAQKRCDEAHAALARAFGALVSISLLTRLGGEVDDYAEVVRSVREVVEERDRLRNASRLLD